MTLAVNMCDSSCMLGNSFEDCSKFITGLTCTLCNVNFLKEDYLMHHMLKHFSRALFYTYNGKKAFSLPCRLKCKGDQVSQRKSGHYHCPACKRVFARAFTFTRHIRKSSCELAWAEHDMTDIKNLLRKRRSLRSTLAEDSESPTLLSQDWFTANQSSQDDTVSAAVTNSGRSDDMVVEVTFPPHQPPTASDITNDFLDTQKAPLKIMSVSPAITKRKLQLSDDEDDAADENKFRKKDAYDSDGLFFLSIAQEIQDWDPARKSELKLKIRTLMHTMKYGKQSLDVDHS